MSDGTMKNGSLVPTRWQDPVLLDPLDVVVKFLSLLRGIVNPVDQSKSDGSSKL